MILLCIKVIRDHCQNLEKKELFFFFSIQGNVNTSPLKVPCVLVPTYSSAFSADTPPHCRPPLGLCDDSHVLLQASEL